MSAIFRTDSGIFGDIQANNMLVTGEIKVGQSQTNIDQYISAEVNTIVGGGIDYSAEINTLSGNINTVSGELNTLSNSIDQINNSGDINKISGSVNDISGELNTLSLAIDFAASNIDTISGAVETIISGEALGDTAFNTVSGRVDSISGDLQSLSGIVDNIEAGEPVDISEISGNLNTISGRVDSLSGVIENINTGSSVDVSQISSRVDTISGDLSGLSSTVDTATGNINTISGAVQSILEAESADDTAFNAVSGRVDTISGDLSGLSSTVDTATGNINTISGAVQSILDAESADDTAFDTISGRIDIVSGDLNTLESTVDTTTGDLYSFYNSTNNLISNTSANLNNLIFSSPTPPAYSNSQGAAGQIAYDDNFLYMCVSDNNWKKLAIASFPEDPQNNPAITLAKEPQVSVISSIYNFDSLSSTDQKFQMNIGTYTFKNVPSDHPIAFLNNSKPVRYGGTTWAGSKTISGVEYDYFYGDVTVDIEGDFGTMSYDCLNHGYMGGENNLIYNPLIDPVGTSSFTINIDYSEYTENALTQEDKDNIQKICDQFEKAILTNGNYTLKIQNFSPTYTSASSGVLAFAGPLTFLTNSITNQARANSGRAAVDPLDLAALRQDALDDQGAVDENSLYWTMLHELGHALGIGPLWNYINGATTLNNYITLDENNGAQYNGSNAVREYNSEMSVNLNSLPVQTYTTTVEPSSSYANRSIPQNHSAILTQEDIDRGYILHNDPWRNFLFDIQVSIPEQDPTFVSGDTLNYTVYITWGGHMGELTPDSESFGFRDLNGQQQPLYEEELMTPYYSFGEVAPLSRITLGFLHDLGFVVDYSQIDPR